MSTFLQLCAKLRQNNRGTGPATVIGQTGELGRHVAWVSDAYVDIQNRHINWRWLRSQFTFNTVAGTDQYSYATITDSRLSSLIARFARWVPHDDRGYPNIKRYLTSTGIAAEGWVTYLPWQDFRKVYKFGARANVTGSPIHITIDPQNNLVLGPKPNDIYTVTGEYQMAPQVLAVDADVPEMPDRFHDLIMYRAMEKTASDASAPERMDRAIRDGNRLMRALEAEQLPQVMLGAPMI